MVSKPETENLVGQINNTTDGQYRTTGETGQDAEDEEEQQAKA